MQIRGRGVDFDRIAEIVAKVSESKYAGNVIVHPDARPIGGRDARYGFSGRLRVVDSSGMGARRSASWQRARRTPATCWHAYRDVLRAIFAEYPHAKIRTMLALYDGAEGFESTYPATADRNIGSLAFPRYMPDLCDCE